MMASIPNMRSTPLTVPAGKAPATGEAVPGDFAAQLPVVTGQPAEAAIQPDPRVNLVAPSVPAPEELDIAPAEEGESAGDAPKAKSGESKDDNPDMPAVVIPFLQTQPVPTAPQPAARAEPAVPAIATPPADAVPTPAPTPTPRAAGKGKAKACDQESGKAGQPAVETPAEPVEASEIEAAVKQLLQRKQVQTRQVAAAPKVQPGDPAGPETAPDLMLPHGRARVQGRSQTLAAPAIKAAAPMPVAELPQPAPVMSQGQPEPLAAEKSATVEGPRTTEFAVDRKLDLARDSQWLDRLARDIAQAGSSDTPLRFRLHPQTLGHLQVELQQGDHGTAVRLTVETEAARQILSDAQPRLAAEARAQGVRIAETHVDLSGSGRHAPGDQRRQDETRQTPFIRTAPGAGAEAASAARPAGRARLDRYA